MLIQRFIILKILNAKVFNILIFVSLYTSISNSIEFKDIVWPGVNTAMHFPQLYLYFVALTAKYSNKPNWTKLKLNYKVPRAVIDHQQMFI